MAIRLVANSTYSRILLSDEECIGEIRVTVKLTNAADEVSAAAGLIPLDQVRSATVQAVVDTGAIRSVIPANVIDQLGALKRGTSTARYADGREEVVGLTFPILFEIQGRSTADEALILGDEVLIGQTVLEKLDLIADCKNQRLSPNPAHPDGPVMRV